MILGHGLYQDSREGEKRKMRRLKESFIDHSGKGRGKTSHIRLVVSGNDRQREERNEMAGQAALQGGIRRRT